jgi:hypothetical protein
MGSWLTIVLLIVEGRGDDLKRTSHVHEVELGMQGKQDIDRLVSHCRPACSHLDDLNGCFVECLGCCGRLHSNTDGTESIDIVREGKEMKCGDVAKNSINNGRC